MKVEEGLCTHCPRLGCRRTCAESEFGVKKRSSPEFFPDERHGSNVLFMQRSGTSKFTIRHLYPFTSVLTLHALYKPWPWLPYPSPCILTDLSVGLTVNASGSGDRSYVSLGQLS